MAGTPRYNAKEMTTVTWIKYLSYMVYMVIHDHYTIYNQYLIQVTVFISFALYCGVPAFEYLEDGSENVG